MPSRADILASTPSCDRLCGPLQARGACGKPMRWVTATDPQEGLWCCRVHGPILSGVDAALRAGFISYIYVEPDAA
jgi:hypothetical protein